MTNGSTTGVTRYAGGAILRPGEIAQPGSLAARTAVTTTTTISNGGKITKKKPAPFPSAQPISYQEAAKKYGEPTPTPVPAPTPAQVPGLPGQKYVTPPTYAEAAKKYVKPPEPVIEKKPEVTYTPKAESQ